MQYTTLPDSATPAAPPERETMTSTGEEFVQVNFRMPKDAFEILEKRAKRGSHMKGRFLSRLLYEYEVRAEERERLAVREKALVEDGQVVT